MIDLFHLELFRKYGSGSGCAVMLGDQEPYESTGFKSARDMMQRLGYTDFIDVDYNGKGVVNHDLNTPIPESLKDKANLLYDGGTIEHVANISEAFKTIVLATKVGGVIFINNPVNDYRKSYYNLDPLMKQDFFELNGFRTLYQIIHYRRNLRIWALRKSLQLLPHDLMERLRLHFKRKAAEDKGQVKSFLFKDKLRHVKTKDVNGFYANLPMLSHSTYVGVKVSVNDCIQWPHQTIYAAA